MLLGTLTRRQRGLETLGFTSRHLKEQLSPALVGTVFILPVVGGVAILADWLDAEISDPASNEARVAGDHG